MNNLNRFAVLLIIPAAAHAQANVRWQDLPAIVYRAAKTDKNAEFTVTLASGQKRIVRQLDFIEGGLLISGDSRPLAATEIAEIRMRHRGRLFSLIEFDVDPFNLATDFLLLPFALALAAITTPPVLVAESDALT